MKDIVQQISISKVYSTSIKEELKIQVVNTPKSSYPYVLPISISMVIR